MNFEIHRRSKPINSEIKYNKSFLLRKRMFRESESFDFESKVICRFTAGSGNERRFVVFVIVSIKGENERLFVDFADFGSADGAGSWRLLAFFNDFDIAN